MKDAARRIQHACIHAWRLFVWFVLPSREQTRPSVIKEFLIKGRQHELGATEGDLNQTRYSPRLATCSEWEKKHKQAQRICVSVRPRSISVLCAERTRTRTPLHRRPLETRLEEEQQRRAAQLRLGDLEEGQREIQMFNGEAAPLESQIIPPSIHPFVSDLHVVAADGKKRGRREEDEEEA